MVADDKALDAQPLAHRGDETGAGARRGVVIFRDHATHDHAAEIVEQREHRGLDRAADILEIDVDPLGTGGGERAAEIAAAMVDASIEADLARHIAAFVGAAGDADNAAAVTLGELSGDRADCARYVTGEIGFD